MDKNIKKIEYFYKYNQIIINDKYLIDYTSIKKYKDSDAIAYNLYSDKDIPLYIFKWMIDNHLLKR